MKDFSGKTHLTLCFFYYNCGGVQMDDVNEKSLALDFFKLFVTPKLVGKIAAETNRYSTECVANINYPSPHLPKWQDTNRIELYVFLAVFPCVLKNFQFFGQ